MSSAAPSGVGRQGFALAVFYLGMAAFPAAGVLLAPVPVAVFAAQKRWALCAALVGAAAVASGIGPGGAGGAMLASLASLLGLPMGFWIAHGKNFNVIVVRSTALVVALNFGGMVTQWDTLDETLELSHSQFEELLESSEGAADTPSNEAMMAFQRWLIDQWPYVLPGLSFAGALMGTCLVVSLTSRWLTTMGAPPVVGSFQTMRPPDWLVWLAILSAGLWFADREWPSDAMRLVGWNLGFALGGVYWLNGLSAAIYVVTAMKLKPTILAIIVLTVFLFGLAQWLPLLGLFDTWGEFRRRIDTRMAERDLSQNSPDDRV